MLKYLHNTTFNGIYFWRKSSNKNLPPGPLPTISSNSCDLMRKRRLIDHASELAGYVNTDWTLCTKRGGPLLEYVSASRRAQWHINHAFNQLLWGCQRKLNSLKPTMQVRLLYSSVAFYGMWEFQSLRLLFCMRIMLCVQQWQMHGYQFLEHNTWT